MNRTLEKVLAFAKKNLVNVILFGAAAVVTVVLLSVLLSWTVKGEAEMTVKTFEATVVGENIQTEYLVRQPFDTDGVAIDIGGRTIPASECSVNADLSAAGERTVTIDYKLDEYTTYSAKLSVHVIFVRGLEIEKYPQRITVGETAEADDTFEMYATLAEKPKSDAFGEAETTERGYRVKLDSGMYTSACVSTSLDGFYNITYYCGDVQTGFSFYNAADRSYIVQSPRDVVKFSATDENTALTLVVTERDESYKLTCTGKSSGYYIYESGGGEQELEFSYALEQTAEVFGSEQVRESADGGEYTAVVAGHTFAANADVWQSAVVGGNIVDDHGFKLVIASDKRILSFTYERDEAAQADENENVPSLTLYVTEYDMNPLLGTGNGFSRGIYVFTDSSGKSYKLTFYLQAWVWTYVPLSANYVDAYSFVSINDYVFNPDADPDHQYNSYFRGTLYAEIDCFERGDGFVKYTFTAPEEQWLGALMNL